MNRERVVVTVTLEFEDTAGIADMISGECPTCRRFERIVDDVRAVDGVVGVDVPAGVRDSGHGRGCPH